MRVAVMANKANVEKYTAPGAISPEWEMVYLGNGAVSPGAVIAADADAILADPMLPVTREMIAGLPRLRLIQSQGVAFNQIDLDAAREAGVYVANCAGVNAAAVAEQAILLMLAVLRRFRENETMVYAARQGEAKAACFENGLRELGDCHVGIVGLGAIGMALAARLRAFGCRVSYYSRREKPESGLPYLPLGELYARCDILSLHAPVTPETQGMMDEAALRQMKPGAILINTARGELVDQAALCRALISGHLGGAGIDTLSPEPVRPDNPLLALPEDVRGRVALSPHIGGVTVGCFHRAFDVIWGNIRRVDASERPINIVNGL